MSDLKMMLLPIFALFALWASVTAKKPQYTNQWVAEIHGGEGVAQRVARDLGFTYKGQIVPFDNHYMLARDDHPEVLLRDSSHLTRALEDFDEVKWAEQQLVVERSKRGILPENHERETDWNKLISSASQYSSGDSSSPANNAEEDPADPAEVGKGDFDSIPKNAFCTKPAEDKQLETYQGTTIHPLTLSRMCSVYEGVFNDPMWDLQWYVQDYRKKDMPVMDHNVVPVYKMGYTGKDITVMIVDDGIEHDHKDLKGNFDESLSYDYCENIAGCKPDQRSSSEASEGTLAAGVIAMVANNHKCGVGIAYKAKISGVKVLCSKQPATTEPESRGLVHELDKVDIYSNSWGMADDGQTMESISRLTSAAIDKGITEGRNKKGAIYLFSAGNGKHMDDNCAADGMVNYVPTIVIASANQFGKDTYYSERCSAVFATAYSGDFKMENLVSVNSNGACMKTNTGTAASVSIASAIIALVLDANSDLTYRDVMHIIAWGSEVAPLASNENTWNKNGRGLWVSKDFGFGLLNAENMVNLAKDWSRVPKKVTCTETIKVIPSQFYAVEGLKLFHDAKACQDKGDNGVRYLEHIELTTTVEYGYRGAIVIYVKSPQGTKTTLLEPRPDDRENTGLRSWTIKSVHNWGENPKGRWIIGVKIADGLKGTGTPPRAKDFTITFHGTHSKPNHYNHPRTYAAFRLPDGRTSHVPS